MIKFATIIFKHKIAKKYYLCNWLLGMLTIFSLFYEQKKQLFAIKREKAP